MPMLLDIMLNGRFICQLNYNKKGYYTKADGKLVEDYKLIMSMKDE